MFVLVKDQYQNTIYAFALTAIAIFPSWGWLALGAELEVQSTQSELSAEQDITKKLRSCVDVKDQKIPKNCEYKFSENLIFSPKIFDSTSIFLKQDMEKDMQFGIYDEPNLQDIKDRLKIRSK
ncbi:hypothetical protein GS597_06350 [Synechococcales cyanobacterium C]|uniref:Uncharacterized protein n=1 Tax=Petrachloros mirabilis ULC683 TaxID=2781853 RepID=A0A8K1ZYA6_9CYAN|nr:hypothetical protein [Petrachloros mirabilis]NCJ06143.1 hypothetical protein [Petrachloros mirabilis ULC683]